MNKIASYLRSHLRGEVLCSDKVRDFYSTDASILTLRPQLVVYPQNTNDVRKTTRFAWQLAGKDTPLPVTARGGGANTTGAALSSGIIISTIAHTNQLLELDTKQQLVRVQPGMNCKTLQDILHSHGYFLPTFSASASHCTVGGAISDNMAGSRSVKYGSTGQWVDKLEVVLANGEVIQTGPISKRELSKKKGLPTLEGEIYRGVDGLLSDNAEVIAEYARNQMVGKNSMGYAIDKVKQKNGSFDLTPLFVGAQGTLGIVVEAIMKIAPYSPRTQLLLAGFDSVESAATAVGQILPLEPSMVDMVDHNLLNFVKSQQDTSPLDGIFDEDSLEPKVLVFVEFDNPNDHQRNKKAKKASKILAKLASATLKSDDPDTQEKIWSVRNSSTAVINYYQNGKAALPIVNDGVVPSDQLEPFVEAVYELLDKYKLDAALWGHAGDAHLHVRPLLDLRKVTDRQKAFKLMDEYYRLVIEMGGSISAENGDGRLRAPYVGLQCGQEMLEIFTQLKNICDPHGVLNPGVKVGTQLKDLAGMLRVEYDTARLADYLPRS